MEEKNGKFKKEVSDRVWKLIRSSWNSWNKVGVDFLSRVICEVQGQQLKQVIQFFKSFNCRVV